MLIVKWIQRPPTTILKNYVKFEITSFNSILQLEENYYNISKIDYLLRLHRSEKSHTFTIHYNSLLLACLMNVDGQTKWLQYSPHFESGGVINNSWERKACCVYVCKNDKNSGFKTHCSIAILSLYICDIQSVSLYTR